MIIWQSAKHRKKLCANTRKKYGRIELSVPKGKKAELKAHAESKEESLNSFINRAIDETIERDKSGDK